jgi:hypothetical protein
MNFTYRLPPMAHQDRHFNLTKDLRYYGNVADMGTGKSKMLIDVTAYQFMQDHINALLIIGNSGSYATWATEHLPTHMPVEVPYTVGLWSSKLSGKKLQTFVDHTLRPGTPHGLLVVVANSEALVWPRSFDLLYAFAKNHKTLTAIDESSTIMNPQSATTKAAHKLRDVSAARRILTGSPIDNRPLEIWAQLEFLARGLSGYTSYYAFKAEFAELQPIYVMVPPRLRTINLGKVKKLAPRILVKVDAVGKNLFTQVLTHLERYNFAMLKGLLLDLDRHLPDEYLMNQLFFLCLGRVQKTVGYRNKDKFRAIINRTCFVVKSEECVDLPEKRYMSYDVVLTVEQQKVYDQLRDEAVAFLNEQDVVSPEVVLTRILRLHQVVCGFVKDDTGLIHRIKNNRLAALSEVLRETRGSGLIYATFVESLVEIEATLVEEYGRDAVRSYYGATSPEARQEAIEATQAGQVRWFITNKTGAFGLNLPILDNMFFYCNDYDARPRNQVEKRIHRIGRDRSRSVLYLDLLTRGTVDEKIVNCLREKKSLSDSLIISNWRDLL